MRLRFLVSGIALLAACGSQSVFSMDIGMCFDNQDSDQLSSVPAVDCSEPHDNEVFALVDYTDSDVYPGDDAINNIALQACIEQFEAFVGLPYGDSELAVFPITPSEASWNDRNDREFVCALYSLDFSKLTGSMRGSAR